MTYSITREHALADALAVQEAIIQLSAVGKNESLVAERLRELRDSIAEQAEPRPDEPTENFSVITATPSFTHTARPLTLLDGSWTDLEGNPCGNWDTFTDVTILRVGLGATSTIQAAAALADQIDIIIRDTIDDTIMDGARSTDHARKAYRRVRELLASADEWARLDGANADEDARAEGIQFGAHWGLLDAAAAQRALAAHSRTPDGQAEHEGIADWLEERAAEVKAGQA